MVHQGSASNARPHVPIVSGQKLAQLEWDFLSRLSHFTALACSGYHLFRSSQNYLDNKNLSSLEDYRDGLERFLFVSQRNKLFHADGITKLSRRWRKVIEGNSLMEKNTRKGENTYFSLMEKGN